MGKRKYEDYLKKVEAKKAEAQTPPVEVPDVPMPNTSNLMALIHWAQTRPVNYDHLRPSIGANIVWGLFGRVAAS